jgi:hypothetical protein
MSTAGAGPVIPATGQVVIPAASARLAELALGQLYRVTVTATFPSRAEILIGNQYLLAATPLRFQAGDVLTLRLVARTPELLQFQLALPLDAQAGDVAAELAVLLRAAALADTPENRAALTLLLQTGVPASGRAVSDIAQLLAALPQAAVAAFMPLYKELNARGFKLDKALLVQLARLAQAAPGLPPLAGALAGLLSQQQRERQRRGGGRSKAEKALEAALAPPAEENPENAAAQIQAQLALLYASPEKAVLDALVRAGAPDAGGTANAELRDLANVIADETADAALAETLALLEALRIANALTPGRISLSLPLLPGAEPTDAELHLQVLAEQYYQKDYALRLRVENETQGKVEFQLRTRGPGLFVDVLAADEETLAAYEAEAARLREELGQGTGFIVRRLEVARHSL